MSFGYQILGFGAFPNRTTTYAVQRSLVFNREEDVYLQRAISGSSTGNTKGTLSTWIKRTVLGTAVQGIFAANNGTAGSSGGHDAITFNSNDQINWFIAAGEDDITWAPRFRDTSAYYNFVIAMDTTQSTDTDRVKLYVNGTLITDYQGSPAHPAEDQVLRGFAYASGTTTQVIGTDMNHSSTSSRNEAGFYLGGDAIYVDGLALAPTVFGKTDPATGIWIPIEPEVTTYGNHGFRLEFKGSDVGTDTSGESNNWTAKTTLGTNNVKPDTATNDTTTGVELYPALDPTNKHSTINLSNANLTHTGTDINFDTCTKVNFPLPSTGKFYFEFVSGSSSGIYVGVALGSTANNESGSANNKGFLYNANGKFYAAPITALSGDTYGDSWTTNDIIGVAIDMTNGGDMWFAKNNTWQSSATASEIAAGTTTNAAITNMPTNTTNSRTYDNSGLFVAISDASASGTGTLRFASGSWSYSAPTGFGELTSTITGVGNFPTWNPNGIAAGDDLTEGNLFITPDSDAQYSSTHSFDVAAATLFYWEVDVVAQVAGSGISVALGILAVDEVNAFPFGKNDGYYPTDWQYIWGSSGKVRDSGSAYTTFGHGDTVMFCAGGGKLWYGVNGTWANSGDPDSGSGNVVGSLTGNWMPAFQSGGGVRSSIRANFGQTPFLYGLTGNASTAVTLNTANLPTPSITDPQANFGSFTYKGNGASTYNIIDGGDDGDGTDITGQLKDKGGTGSRWTPDFVWIKNRTGTGASAHIYDVIRGANNFLRSTTNAAENSSRSDMLKSFDSGGFTLGADASEEAINKDNDTYVAWCWKAGGSASTVTNGMTQISDTSVNSNISRSVNTDAKFSIFTYTGTGNASKIQHGLGVTPDMFWIKCRDTTQGWHVWHKDMDTTNKGYTILNNGQKYETFSDFRIWGSNSFPDATHLMVGTHAGTNNSGDDFVGYAWAGVDGYSSFGKYEGVNSTDNTYIHLGFKPSLFICKNIDSGVDGATQSDWLIFDSIRNPFNDTSANYLKANLTAVEGNFDLDFLATGVKIRTNEIHLGTAETFIYMAWAERPFALNNRAR